MKNVKIFPLTLLALLLPSLLWAQFKQDTNVNMSQALVKPGKLESIVGLLGLDPNKFSMSHSYEVSFGSFGGDTYNQGLYLNTMQYQFSNPLSMYFQLGFRHQPFGSSVGNTQLGSDIFVAGAGMKYQPTKNLRFQLEFSQHPANTYTSPFFRDPISRNRAWFDGEKEKDSEN